MSIGQKVAAGSAWMLALRLGLRGIGFISTLVLARLLTPEDFGLVAIAMSFIAIVDLFGDFGFDTAIIQHQAPDRSHYDTAWTFNMLFGATAAAVVVLSADAIGDWYGNADLAPLLTTFALLFLVNGARNVGVLDFRKHMDFNLEFRLHLLPKLVSFVVTLVAAWTLRSYWALAIGSLTQACASLACGYLMHDFRPRLSFGRLRELGSFSKWLFANNMIQVLYLRAPELVIGRSTGISATGLFAVGRDISTLVTTEVSASISRAAYPGFASVQRDLDAARRLYLQTTAATAALVVPAGLGVAAVADPAVPLLLGDQWIPAVPLVAPLALAGTLIALNNNIGYLFMALGRPRLTTLISIVRVLVLLVGLFALVPAHGASGAAWALLGTASLVSVLVVFMARAQVGLGLLDHAAAVIRPLAAGIAMWVAVQQVSVQFDGLSGWALLGAEVAFGAATYLVLAALLWLLSGRPDGPESAALALVQRARSRGAADATGAGH